MLQQLEDMSKATQADLVKMRIEHWKANGSDKKQALGNVDSIQRNLQGALPGLIAQLRTSPGRSAGYLQALSQSGRSL